jgi:soluble lytic murein transglycosylase-like protein
VTRANRRSLIGRKHRMAESATADAAPRAGNPPAEFVALADDAARAHSLWPELVCAIVEQESSWDRWALRYEPAFYARYVEPQLARGIIPESEARARAFSWGLMQVMGQVAREHGFVGASLAALCDPVTGLDVGCRVFAAKLAAAEGNVARALLIWNGGANRDYPAQVLARAAHYGLPEFLSF